MSFHIDSGESVSRSISIQQHGRLESYDGPREPVVQITDGSADYGQHRLPAHASTSDEGFVDADDDFDDALE